MDKAKWDKTNILLVDDREENLLALEAVLCNPDYNLVQVTSGEQALSALLHSDFAVILLDVQMPGMDGFETALLIKKREKSEQIPIIFLTAIHKDELHSIKGYEVGGVDYIYKPFDPNSLRSKVAIYVNIYRKNQDLEKRAESLLASEKAVQDRKLVELEVETQSRFELLAEAIPQIVWTTDALGIPDYLNQRWYDFTGATPRQSESIEWFQWIHPDDREKTYQNWTRASETGQFQPTEHRIRRKDGVYQWHLTRATPLKNTNKNIVKWFGTCTNIEDQKQAESKLKKSELQLKKAVQARQELLAVVSHDLRNPISAIQLNVQMAQRLAESPAPQNLRKQLERIKASALRANQLIHDLLDSAQIDSGHLKLDLKKENFIGVLDEVLEMLKASAREKSIQLIQEAPPQECWVECDHHRLHQALSNLISNAIKFTPNGGTVRASVICTHSGINIDIVDNGIGISEEFLPHIFDRYWKAKKSSHTGVGLGLSITKGIVEAHGGQVLVKSSPSQGSTFTLKLPYSHPA